MTYAPILNPKYKNLTVLIAILLGLEGMFHLEFLEIFIKSIRNTVFRYN